MSRKLAPNRGMLVAGWLLALVLSGCHQSTAPTLTFDLSTPSPRPNYADPNFEAPPTMFASPDLTVLILLPDAQRLSMCAADVSWQGSRTQPENIFINGCPMSRSTMVATLRELLDQKTGGLRTLRSDVDSFVGRFARGELPASGQKEVLVGVREGKRRLSCILTRMWLDSDTWILQIEVG